MRTTGLLLAILIATALMPDAVDARAKSTVPEAPAGQPSREHYVVFLAPPSSVIGAFETRVGYETAGGQSGEGGLTEDLGELILMNQTLASLTSPSTPYVSRFMLTSGAVDAVSVDGGTPIETVPAVGPPYEFRSAMYEIPGLTRGESAYFSFRTLDASGQPIDTPPPPKPLPNPALETRNWEAPAPAARGVCQVTADRFPGLTAQSGSVVSVVRPLVGAIGQPYLTCANTRYVYRFSPTDESSLVSFMALDADHPGVEPAAIPAMEPVAGHPGVFQSRVTERELVGRRVPGAWLFVEGGRDLQQQLTLLANLRGSVRLPAKTTHHRASHKRRR